MSEAGAFRRPASHTALAAVRHYTLLLPWVPFFKPSPPPGDGRCGEGELRRGRARQRAQLAVRRQMAVKACAGDAKLPAKIGDRHALVFEGGLRPIDHVWGEARCAPAVVASGSHRLQPGHDALADRCAGGSMRWRDRFF